MVKIFKPSHKIILKNKQANYWIEIKESIALSSTSEL